MITFGRFNAAMAHAKGRFPEAAAYLAEELADDPEFRAEVAALVIALLLEPGFSQHRETFRADTGQRFEDFVRAKMPPEGGAW